MRILITEKESDLTALAAGLARNTRAAGTTLDRVVALNPQLADAARVPAGTVLVLPEDDLKAGVGTVVGGSTLTDFGEAVGAGIRAAGSRAADRLATLVEEQAEVKKVRNTAAVKKLLASDPLLTKRLDAAEANFKAEQKEATANNSRFAEIQKAAAAEFALLEKLLG